ncbi:hypothetical protein SNEBB_004497, partial [Seison nebaliae]
YHEKLVRDNAERDKVRNFVEKKLKEKKLLRKRVLSQLERSYRESIMSRQCHVDDEKFVYDNISLSEGENDNCEPKMIIDQNKFNDDLMTDDRWNCLEDISFERRIYENGIIVLNEINQFIKRIIWNEYFQILFPIIIGILIYLILLFNRSNHLVKMLEQSDELKFVDLIKRHRGRQRCGLIDKNQFINMTFLFDFVRLNISKENTYLAKEFLFHTLTEGKFKNEFIFHFYNGTIVHSNSLNCTQISFFENVQNVTTNQSLYSFRCFIYITIIKSLYFLSILIISFVLFVLYLYQLDLRKEEKKIILRIKKQFHEIIGRLRNNFQSTHDNNKDHRIYLNDLYEEVRKVNQNFNPEYFDRAVDEYAAVRHDVILCETRNSKKKNFFFITK